MNSESLDAWFARADDILADWNGSTDAMVARVPDSDDADALPGDSYYEQPREHVWSPWAAGTPRIEFLARATRDLRIGLEQIGAAARRQIAEHLLAFGEVSFSSDQFRLLERALSTRRNRNTGPADPYRLDGRRQ